MNEFKRGDLMLIAKGAGVSLQKVCDYLAGRRNVRASVAMKLAREADKLGYDVSFHEWLQPHYSMHTLFQAWRKRATARNEHKKQIKKGRRNNGKRTA